MAENLELDPLKKPMDTSLCEAKKKGTDLPLKDSFFEMLQGGGTDRKKVFLLVGHGWSEKRGSQALVFDYC